MNLLKKPSLFAHFFTRCRIPCACHAKTTCDRPKAVRTPQFLTRLTWKVFRATKAYTFSTSERQKAVRTPQFFTEMCFAPQRHALFEHFNFQTWSQRGVLCTCLLGNVLRATTACAFSTAQLEKVVRTWCAFYLLTWKRALRHNGVQFFISYLTTWLRTRCFSEPTFRPS